MLISHLSFFISLIALLAYVPKMRSHLLYERLLMAFTLLYSVTGGVWLYTEYYGKLPEHWVDNYGLFSENILLLIPVLAIQLLRERRSTRQQVIQISALLGMAGALYFIHRVIAGSPSELIFFPTNQRVLYNILFQLTIDGVLFFLFMRTTHLKQEAGTDLFDGNFKWIFRSVFASYYIQDMIILIGLLMALRGMVLVQYVYYLTLGLNLIVSLLLVFLAVYVNWLKLFNQFRSQNGSPTEQNIPITSIRIDLEPIRNKSNIDWNLIALTYGTAMPSLISEIEQLSFLTKTEKMYAFLQLQDFSYKELSSLLSVSERTVETNLYRLRLKLKQNAYSTKYPYRPIA